MTKGENQMVISWKWALPAALSIALMQISPARASEEADLILTNADVYTPDGWAKSVAVRDGIIVAVGDDAATSGFKGSETRILDLGGQTLFPGLYDMHVHPLLTAVARTGCMFGQDSSPVAIADVVAACIEQRGPGQWITGGSWTPAMLAGDVVVDRRTLDAVSPDNPVALTDLSHHSLWVNSKALELAGIDSETPDPAGGRIERNAEGEPTGFLRENATKLVSDVVTPLSHEETVAALRSVLDHILSFGITSFTDALVDEPGLEAYAALADTGELKQRAKLCIQWLKAPGEAPMGNDLIDRRNEFGRPGLTVNCVKVLLDGIPFDSRTAAMLDPYKSAPHEHNLAPHRGSLMVAAEDLSRAAVDFDARGLSMVMHATGDAAVREALDAIEAARSANGWSGQLHQIAHANFVHPDDIARARQVGATFEFSPYVWAPVPPVDIDVRKAVGDERLARFDPVREAIDAGALVVVGSDWEVVPSVNPWPAIESLVTRELPGGSEKQIAPAERISLKEAIDLFTVNGARQMLERDKRGSIEVGMVADLIVLDRNPFDVPIREVGETKVSMTLIGGEVVFQRR